jgi:hypothetical protein
MKTKSERLNVALHTARIYKEEISLLEEQLRDVKKGLEITEGKIRYLESQGHWSRTIKEGKRTGFAVIFEYKLR